MKIALALTGIASGHGRDFEHCYPNLQEKLIAPYQKDHEVFMYLTTYSTERDAELLSRYTPVRHTFIKFKGSHQVDTYIQSMEQLRGQNIDFIIATRFDIHFHKEIAAIGIDYDKFNVLFKEKGWWKWWSKNKFTTDNFFAFPYTLLEDFIAVLKDMRAHPARATCTDLHHAFYRMQKRVGKEKVSIISPLQESSHLNNSFYTLCRKK